MKLITALFLLAFPASSFACTTVHVGTQDGATVIGRTMELGNNQLSDLWNVVIHQRDTVLGADMKKNKLGFVSIDVELPHPYSVFSEGLINSAHFASEGMNERGLTVSVQTHRGAVYQDSDSSAGKVKVTNSQLAQFLLGRCADVKSVISILEDELAVTGNKLPTGARTHWAVVDASGSSIVVEYLNGKLSINQNFVGVLTNDPEYSWHLTNLNNYASLSPSYSDTSSWGTSVISADNVTTIIPTEVGHGYNLISAPGGYSPPSRFVRSYVLKQHSVSQLGLPVDYLEGIKMITGILNNVHIVRGSVPNLKGEDKDSQFELTHWSVIKIPERLEFMFRGYGEMAWKRVDLKAIKWGEGEAEYKDIRVDGGGVDIIEVEF
jgi:choloylglycine hydrolase